MPTDSPQHRCPSCGRPTTPTPYALEPDLCVDCQRAYGVVSAEGADAAEVAAPDAVDTVAVPPPAESPRPAPLATDSPWPAPRNAPAPPKAPPTAAPVTAQSPVAPQAPAAVAPDDGVSPDAPVWGTFAALGVWISAIFALVAAAGVSFAGYLLYAGRHNLAIPAPDKFDTDPVITVVGIVSSALAHLLTVAIAYVVVTDGGRRPFMRSLGWTWPARFGLPQTILAAIALQVFAAASGIFITPPESTPFGDMMKSSLAAKVAIAIIAVLSAPFAEEVVYRGVLYPAFARPLGRPAAILVVSILFLLPHVDQYAGALAIMVPLGALSLALTALRAYTKSMLPSFVLHTLFNGITIFFTFLQPSS